MNRSRARVEGDAEAGARPTPDPRPRPSPTTVSTLTAHDHQAERWCGLLIGVTLLLRGSELTVPASGSWRHICVYITVMQVAMHGMCQVLINLIGSGACGCRVLS
ncbi:hypothetical protein MMAN_38360 [Mycobacterium mantenii]|uniref:Uncharacterized protein n=1 Tax=Mycobacterium mantenii TaxID=560555 RepID=A0ABM7JVX4_MYCNT|nr:hypothetical protein MMAN_38360 [Mycobacterium mantenii]